MISGVILKMAMAGAPLKTHQKAVSVPAINRYIDMLRAGKIAPPIKVDNGIIVEGNHRYVAGYFTRMLPPIIPYIDVRKNDPVHAFDEIEYDPADWGNH